MPWLAVSRHLPPSASVVPVSSLTSNRHRPHRGTFAVARATSKPFHGPVTNHSKSILLIRSERSTSAARIAANVSRNVLTFDPSDTIPPITTAIDPMAVT